PGRAPGAGIHDPGHRARRRRTGSGTHPRPGQGGLALPPGLMTSRPPGGLTPSVSWNPSTAREARPMQQHELDTLFDQQAAGYDAQWARMAPIRESLHFLLETVFADLPEDARLLCVGAGTGAEIAHLARRFPRWR